MPGAAGSAGEAAAATQAPPATTATYPGAGFEQETAERRIRIDPSPEQFEDARRLEAVGRLAAGISHDFNNLLSVILSYSDELERSLSDRDQREQAREIRAAAERGASLTRRLLAYSRRDPSERQLVNLNHVVLETAELLVRALGERVILRCEPAAGVPHVLLAPGQAEQILVNLGANSRDAMPEGGTVTIRTGMASVPSGDPCLGPGWYARLSVTDDGEGMPEEVADRAMEPFFTTKHGHGTGLGLATVYGIARDAGGDVRISSTPGNGTSISVYLPAVRRSGERLSMRGRSDAELEEAAADAGEAGWRG